MKLRLNLGNTYHLRNIFKKCFDFRRTLSFIQMIDAILRFPSIKLSVCAVTCKFGQNFHDDIK